MPDHSDDAPFVDPDSRGGLSDALSRILQTVAPDSLVAGGATDDNPLNDLKRKPRNYDELKRRENIYAAGGPISDFIKTRALMTYGTGIEFVTDEEEVTELVNGEPMTVADWLHDALPRIDSTMIQRGIHAYVYGDAWPEVVTTRSGDLSHINLLHPTTVDARWDAHGEITSMQQIVTDGHGGVARQPLDLDTVGHWFFENYTAGPLGDSLLAQNEQEIEWYLKNQQQRANAIRLHGSPKYHIKAGSEGQSVSDTILRRIRNRFRSSNTDEKTNWVTGGDIEIGELDAPGFEGMNQITETDVMKLSSGFGVPIEWTNFGSAGLGDGAPADSRIEMFENQAHAEQRVAAEQLKDFPLRWIVDELSPFPPGTHFDVHFGEVRSQNAATAEWLQPFMDAYTWDEIREKFGDPPLTDEQREELPDREQDAAAAGGGGLFTERDDPGEDAPDPLDARTKRMHTDGGAAMQESQVVTFSNVGGDPFEDQDSMDAFLEELDEAAEGQVYIGKFPWPEADNPPIHDRPITAVGISEGEAQAIFDRHESNAYAIGGAKAVDDPVSVFMTEGDTDFSHTGRALLHAEADADALTQEELVWQEVYERVLWAEDTDRALFAFDPEEVPQFVLENLREAIQAGALFSDFDSIPATAAAQIGDVLLDSLETRHGWSVDSLARNIQETAPGVSYDDAERVARTETQALVNQAREQGYEEEFDLEEERFDWVGPDTNSTTEACKWIKSKIPDGGVSLERIRELVAEAPEHDDRVNTQPRRYTPHISCRHTFSRQV